MKVNLYVNVDAIMYVIVNVNVTQNVYVNVFPSLEK